MRIYVDFDDVICETAQPLAVLAKGMFARDVPFEQIHTFDLQVAFHLDRAQYLALMDRAHAVDFLLALPPVAGSVACLQAWLRQGHEVMVVTGRPSSTHKVNGDWLQHHGMAALPIMYVDKYNRRHPVLPDAPPCLQLSALLQEHFDVVIDDAPMVLDALRTRSAGSTFVFDRPWNRKYDCTGERVTRCCGWVDVQARVEGLEGSEGREGS